MLAQQESPCIKNHVTLLSPQVVETQISQHSTLGGGRRLGSQSHDQNEILLHLHFGIPLQHPAIELIRRAASPQKEG